MICMLWAIAVGSGPVVAQSVPAAFLTRLSGEGPKAFYSGSNAQAIVTAVNREPVATIDGFTRSVRAAAQGPIALNLIRGDSRMVLIVQ